MEKGLVKELKSEICIALLLALNALVNFWIYRDIHSFFGNIVEVKESGSKDHKIDGGTNND